MIIAIVNIGEFSPTICYFPFHFIFICHHWFHYHFIWFCSTIRWTVTSFFCLIWVFHVNIPVAQCVKLLFSFCCWTNGWGPSSGAIVLITVNQPVQIFFYYYFVWLSFSLSFSLASIHCFVFIMRNAIQWRDEPIHNFILMLIIPVAQRVTLWFCFIFC